MYRHMFDIANPKLPKVLEIAKTVSVSHRQETQNDFLKVDEPDRHAGASWKLDGTLKSLRLESSVYRTVS